MTNIYLELNRPTLESVVPGMRVRMTLSTSQIIETEVLANDSDNGVLYVDDGFVPWAAVEAIYEMARDDDDEPLRGVVIPPKPQVPGLA